MNSEKNWWDKIRPYVELGGVGLLAVYTAFTIAMYFANKKSADAAQVAAKAAKETLEEVRRGGTDTHDLAVAGGKQADAAKNQADNTDKLAKAAVDQVRKLEAGVMETML